LLLVNDGQDLLKMDFNAIIKKHGSREGAKPLLIAAIHCGPDRHHEYGVSKSADYKGRGSKAPLYEKFIVAELLPLIRNTYSNIRFTETAFAGFSLGGLSAIDIVWNNAGIFSKAGIFSASLWWRSADKHSKDYDQSRHRLMHQQIRESEYKPGLQFFFECGELDEVEDRNRNGVIDSIDDTIDLMRELLRKGYNEGIDFKYLQLPEGRHDVPSWEKAFPYFLKWGWGK
jgi:enterochelin esterase-like enzyme